MRRRDFLGALGSAAAAWPLIARAQQPELMRRIGVLQTGDESDPEVERRIAIFVENLQKLGWREGANLMIDYRFGGDNSERIRLYAAELVGLKPDLIWASGGLPLLALERATRIIPIIFTTVYDPVGSGYVASLAQPGGNITGFTLGEFSMGGKMLDVLKEVAPQVSRAAVILTLDQPAQVAMLRAIEAVTQSLKVRITMAAVHDAAEIEREINAFSALARNSNGGLIVLPSPVTIGHRNLIIALAAQHHLPAIYFYRYFVDAGGLISYGIDPADQFRQAATYVDRVLRGEKPSDLPVQQPTKFELAINLKTAKTLGLTVPPTLLTRADEVIE